MNSEQQEKAPPAGVTIAIVSIAVAAGAACAILLWLWLLPRGCEGVWQWELRSEILAPFPWTIPATIAVLLAATFTLDTVRTTNRPSGVQCILLVVALTVTCGSLMAGMAFDDTNYLLRASAAILGNNTMGYYAVASETGDDIVDWTDDPGPRTDLEKVPARVATHPPGPVIYYWLVNNWLSSSPGRIEHATAIISRLYGSDDFSAPLALARSVAPFGPEKRDVVIALAAGLLLTLAAPLVVPVMFGIGVVAAGRRVALTASAITATIPSLLCFNPTVDAAGILMASLTLLLWLWALRFPHSWLPAALCGLMFTIATFWNFGLIAIIAVVAPVAIGLSVDSELSVTDVMRQAAISIIFVVAAFTALSILVGYDPVASMRGSLHAHHQIMEPRPYRLSVIWNPYEFILFAGPTLIIAAMAGIVMGLSQHWKPRLISAIGISVLLTVIALTISGQTRGEVGRIWGFLMPPLTVPAALTVLQLKGRAVIFAGLLIAVGQLALAISINSNLLLVGF